MPKPTEVKLTKKARKNLNNMLQDIMEVMEDIEHEEETLTKDQPKNKARTAPYFTTSTDGAEDKEKEFNGQNIYEAIIDGHDQLAEMMQEHLASIIKDKDADLMHQAVSMVLHANVADVFNQTNAMFKELCRNYDHFIIEGKVLIPE